MKQVIILFYLAFTAHSYANDGAFYARGNQLIPVMETSVSVQREILRVKRLENNQISVSVYYEFFNPESDKKILTGFEAMSPSGDVDGTPEKGKHPYMSDFSVMVNGEYLPYQVAIVRDSLYYQNGRFISIPESELVIDNPNSVDFNYVYYFEPYFKKGVNIVEHSYLFKTSGSVEFLYDFSYVLTAANRWANKQIDDFTLIIDMGDFQELSMPATFFRNRSDWILSGMGKSTEIESDPFFEIPSINFAIRNGVLIFQKKDFKPAGELFLYALAKYAYCDGFNYKICELPFSPEMDHRIGTPVDDFSKKVLRNLPFARRGYVFKNETLQAYFVSQSWYTPNPGYEANPELLPQAEQDWIKTMSN